MNHQFKLMPIFPPLSLTQRLSTRIAGALIGFLVLALLAIGTTLWLSWQLQGAAAAINETGGLRMQSYRLTVLLSQHMAEPDRAERAAAVLRQIDGTTSTLVLISSGDPQRPLALPDTDVIRSLFRDVSQRWHEVLRPMVLAVLRDRGTEQSGAWRQYESASDQFVARVNQLVGLIEQDMEKRAFWLRSSQLALVALALFGTVAMIYLMYIFIIEPARRLREGMRRMEEKDFSLRLPVESRDEFGELTRGFNQMADRLQALYDSLEDRVSNKTASLAEKNRELALLYDCSAFLQLPQNLEVMCEGFLQRIYPYFGADGGSVSLLNQGGSAYLNVDHGISTALIEEARPDVPDASGDAGEHAAKPHASAIVFQILSQQERIGLFGLNYLVPRSLSQRDQALLQTLVQLLGVAIDNRRLSLCQHEMKISEERNLIAQGLHDSIAQGLNFLNIQIQMLDDSLHDGKVSEAAGILPALRSGVQESYDDVRELLLSFRMKIDEEDLTGALNSLAENFRRETGMEVRLIGKSRGVPLEREQQLQVLFIVQEALSNIRKHAQATDVEICIEDRLDFLLSIRDNGVGFDAIAAMAAGSNHAGLRIMHERAQRIHAQLDVESAIGGGTTLKLKLVQMYRCVA